MIRALRAEAVAIALVAGAGIASGVNAGSSTAFLGQNCPAYGGWLLYHSGDGGSGGIQGVYTATHGECVSFFLQNPNDTFIGVVNENPQP